MGRIARFLSGAGRPREDHSGQRFGCVIALREVLGDDDRWYWECRCDCGRTRLIQTRTLVRRPPSQCLCDRSARQQATKNAPGITARNHLYATYRNNAQKRGLLFDLTMDEFTVLTQQRCYYCGAAPMTEHRARLYRGAYLYNGIDRRDNDEGYTPANALPCCQTCNYMKRDLSFDDFMDWIDRLVSYRA